MSEVRAVLLIAVASCRGDQQPARVFPGCPPPQIDELGVVCDDTGEVHATFTYAGDRLVACTDDEHRECNLERDARGGSCLPL
jgi:hypothetical protein